MLYYLFRWLDQFDFPGAGMFAYTSFRALMAVILALLISTIWGDRFIRLLKRKQITETQRDASVDPFGVNKTGVPSMGGVIINIQARQGRIAWQVQNYRASGAGTDCRLDFVPQPASCHS